MNETTTDIYNTPGEFDVIITRVETIRVHAPSSDAAIDMAIEGAGDSIDEETINVDVEPASGTHSVCQDRGMTNTTTYTEQQLDDWGNIFGASAGVWSWWREISHLDGGDWDKPSRVRLTIESPEYPTGTNYPTLTVICEPQEIFAALAEATEKYPWHFGRRDGLLDLDASSADLVLQVALFGEAVYG